VIIALYLHYVRLLRAYVQNDNGIKMINLKKPAVAFALVLMSGASFSSPITNGTGITNATSTITFSEVALSSGTTITSQYAGYGATFSPFAVFRPQDGFYTTDYIGNFGGQGTASPFVISFDGVVSGAAFDFISNSGTSLFEALMGSTVVESFLSATSPTTGTFYGFDGVMFDSIRITAPGNQAFEMDNLQVRNEVPEPSTIFLLGAGLIGVCLRKRNKA